MPDDPFRNFNFILELDNIQQAGFSECSGFGATSDPIEYREGNENPGIDPKTVRKLPGMAKYDNISLKWGLTDSTELYEWYRNIERGIVDRRNGSVIVLDTEGQEVMRWNFEKAWPTKWTGPSFNATDNAVAIEALDLAHEGVKQAAIA